MQPGRLHQRLAGLIGHTSDCHVTLVLTLCPGFRFVAPWPSITPGSEYATSAASWANIKPTVADRRPKASSCSIGHHCNLLSLKGEVWMILVASTRRSAWTAMSMFAAVRIREVVEWVSSSDCPQLYSGCKSQRWRQVKMSKFLPPTPTPTRHPHSRAGRRPTMTKSPANHSPVTRADLGWAGALLGSEHVHTSVCVCVGGMECLCVREAISRLHMLISHTWRRVCQQRPFPARFVCFQSSFCCRLAFIQTEMKYEAFSARFSQTSQLRSWAKINRADRW